MRHWVGKAAFCATFRRPLFSILQDVFDMIEETKKGAQVLTNDAVDEILTFMVLAVQGQSELRAEVSKEITCTDASPTGGGTAVAGSFKTKSLLVPEVKEQQEDCGNCCTKFEGLARGQRKYPCPRRCGERFCSAQCVASHETSCARKDFYSPRFGERFSGPNYPLTKACGLAGISIQPPMDLLVDGYAWDLTAAAGKAQLEEAECDEALKATHWAPECKSFSRARGRWIQLPDGSWIEGPRQLRSELEPWGFEKGLKADEQVVVRRGNLFVKASVKGIKRHHRAGGVGSMEHPYNSYAWETEELHELAITQGWFVSEYSHCCFGGDRVKWTKLIHNCPYLHDALHRPHCPGHSHLRDYAINFRRDGSLAFDTALEAEYPWGSTLRL